MASKSFQNLDVYRLSEVLADSVWCIVRNWPVHDRRTVGAQLVRAADSIGTNIAEGSGRGSYIDNRRFVRYARGSLYETRHWLRGAYARQLLEQQDRKELSGIIDELSPRLNAYINAIGRQGPGGKNMRDTARSQ